MKVTCLIVVVISLLAYFESSATTYRVDIKPRAGEAFARAEYTLWIPEGVDQIQRIILHQHGCGDDAQIAGQTATDDLHRRLLAQNTQSALLGSSLWPQGGCGDWSDPDRGTERAFLQALDELAQRSNHPEVATVNWVVWGHSGGGYWTYMMLDKYPTRFDAAVFQSPGFRPRDQRGGELQHASYHPNVPLLIHLGIEEKEGERFGTLYDDGVRTFALMREKGAPVATMEYLDKSAQAGNTYYYQVSLVNWAELESPLSPPVEITFP